MKYSRESKKLSLWLVFLAYILAFAAAFLIYPLLPANYSLLVKTLIVDMAATILVFIFSMIFNNSSFYDPYWSVAPPIIFSFWFFSSINDADFPLRGLIILFIAGFWGIRLTLNWALTWPGLVHEDWRYVTFREKFGRFYWPISFLAIHFFPTLIVFLCSVPVYLVLSSADTALNYIDIIAAVAGLIAVYFEWRSDYELITHRKSSLGNKPIMKGLWKYSRHPNYFGEILFWISLYIFALASNLGNYWIGFAPLAMLCLFLFYSIPAMEKRQMKSRPEYKVIRESISMLFPFPPKEYEKIKTEE